MINQHRRSLPSFIARQIEIELRGIEHQVEPCGKTRQRSWGLQLNCQSETNFIVCTGPGVCLLHLPGEYIARPAASLESITLLV